MLSGVFGGSGAFLALFLLITAGSLWELMDMLLPDEPLKQGRKAAGTVFGLIPFAVVGIEALEDQPAFGRGLLTFVRTVEIGGHLSPILTALVLLVFLTFIILLTELFLQSSRPLSSASAYLLGVVYIGAPFTFLISLAFWHEGYEPLRVLGLLLLNWTNDTMAYVVGSRIGRRPFFSRISPKKTWEGTFGGVVFTFLVAFGLSNWIEGFSLREWMLLAACVSVFGTLGDLVESMLKRSVQVKDSGTILPGHGGFLDRFDSFIFVLPFAWLVLMLFGG